MILNLAVLVLVFGGRGRENNPGVHDRSFFENHKYGPFQSQSVKNDFFTPKPLDRENQGKSCNFYQRMHCEAGNPCFTGFSGFRISLLAHGNHKLNDFVYMARIPKDAIFSAENMAADGDTFVSCVTTPKLRYEGFRLIPNSERRESLEQL